MSKLEPGNYMNAQSVISFLEGVHGQFELANRIVKTLKLDNGFYSTSDIKTVIGEVALSEMECEVITHIII